MTAAAEPHALRRRRVSPLTRAWGFVRRHTITVFGILALAYLMLPIVVVVVFSFNDPAGRFNYTWEGFTAEHWRHPFGPPFLGDAVVSSLKVGVIATIVSVVLGTLVALALVRYHFRGRGTTNLLIFVPLTAPEIVLGASLLTLFLNLGTALGFWTIVIAHIMFCISFVVVTVRARLVGFDRHVEEAAMDLGANEYVTFYRITLPLIAPGILAGALLAFSLSIDDFVITNFNSGTTQTFPLYVWSQAQRGVPPEVNVIGTMIFAVAIVLMIANILFQWRRTPKGAAA
jgi:spermidine/putrescine transport system permease protein